MTTAFAPRPRLWARADFERMAYAGVFGPSDKARVYAEAGVPEYWTVNVVEEVLEVHREPGKAGYRSVSRLRSGEVVSPLAAPGAGIPVADLLP